MEICVFYSWQSSYRNNCDKIISKAIDKAIKELNKEKPQFHYTLERGGGDVLGAEHIDNNIDKIIKHKADIAILDFTHVGNPPRTDDNTGEIIKFQCYPNPNVLVECGKLEAILGERQVLKVYNTAYGDLKANMYMPFDLRQQHYPLDFKCDDAAGEEERKEVVNNLKNSLRRLIIECTNEFLEHQKIRYAPLIPLHNEFRKKFWQGKFYKNKHFCHIYDKITSGDSFRLIGLPGLGKTRMVGEAFKSRDLDVYYCDCREQSNRDVELAVDKLMGGRGDKKQTVILDNCSQKLCSYVADAITDNGYNCQLISIYYDPTESVDSGIDSIHLKVGDAVDVIDGMLDAVDGISKENRESIESMACGFPLMAQMMIENYQKGQSVLNVSKKDIFERMLGIDSHNSIDQDKLRVLTAFSVFKFIGLYGQQEKQGRFIASNRIVTGIRGTEDDNLHLFKEVYGQYSKMEILERQGNLVLMRLIPLAIYLCKLWFDKQTPETIRELVEQICSHHDEGTRNMLIESLSKRIVLLSEIPLANDLRDGLTNPDKSPFLSEEVVLSAVGSRLFLAFSEVNPEACAFALNRIISEKTDEEIVSIEQARRNLAWALDHLAFDKRSFRKAMFTLARLSLVETEDWLSNNTTGLFVDRFPILLAGTEADLKSRVEVLKELLKDVRYSNLIKASLHRALGMGHFHRTGGAEKQGTRILKDYYPNFSEVAEYLNECFSLLYDLAKNQQEMDEIAKTFANNAREYYRQGMDDFLISGLNILASQKKYVWEEMKDALVFIIEYDAPKRGNYRLEELVEWKKKLSKEDYVYILLHAGKEINRHYRYSFEQEQRNIRERYCELAQEFIDKELYKDESILRAILYSKCFYYHIYGAALSDYSLKKNIQDELLDKIVQIVLNEGVSNDGETLMLYFLMNVQEAHLLNKVYEAVSQSRKRRLMPAIYAIKAEGIEKQTHLFELLDRDEIALDDFAGYFNYLFINSSDFKYVASSLLNYGSKGAQIVLKYCHSLLFENLKADEETESIGRRCLLQMDLHGVLKDEHVFVHCLDNYLDKHDDIEMVQHIQTLQEQLLDDISYRDSYYMGKLYRKVLIGYSDLLRPRIFELLEERKIRHQWIDLLRTSFPQDEGESLPIYTLIENELWFEWLNEKPESDRAYILAMLFSYADSEGADSTMVRLIDSYWGESVKDALSARIHSYSWTGSGIPLYYARIALCKDYIAKLSNEDAKVWFKQDISFWQQEIERERLQNAHERALYD